MSAQYEICGDMLVKISPDHPPMCAPYTDGPVEPRDWKPLDFTAKIVEPMPAYGVVRTSYFFPQSPVLFIGRDGKIQAASAP